MSSLPLCGLCKHMVEGECKAFEDGLVPPEILDEIHDHRLPYPGDRGITFELDDDPEAQPLFEAHYAHVEPQASPFAQTQLSAAIKPPAA